MRPRVFRELASAVRWSWYGGVALYLPSNTDLAPALYASAQSSELPHGWARYYAGKAGAILLDIQDRGTGCERIALTRPQAATISEQCVEGGTIDSLPTTVVFFTGSRDGITVEQEETLRDWLFRRDVIAAHHGLCVGADNRFHDILAALKDTENGKPWLVGWPAEVPPELTIIDSVKCNDVHTKQAPLTRNRQMAEYAKWRKTGTDGAKVEAVACPKECDPPSNGRGGTWHAIRQFQAAGIPVAIIMPHGMIRT
jgi:hypothetical protein